MRYKLSVFLIVMMFCFFQIYAQNKIIVEARMQDGYKRDSIILRMSPEEYFTNGPDWINKSVKVVDNKARWEFFSTAPMIIMQPFLLGRNVLCIAEPGDSIVITHDKGESSFSGKGAKKFKIAYTAAALKRTVSKPATEYYYAAKSLQEYLEWSQYLDAQLKLVIPFIDLYRDSISSFSYNRLRADIICWIEFERAQKFQSLRRCVDGVSLSISDLVRVMDSTLNKPEALWVRSFKGSVSSVHYFDTYNFLEVFRKYGFDLTSDSINTKEKRRIAYYNTAKLKYKGKVREKLLVYILTREAIHDIGFVPETELILSDYYSWSDYSSYKQYVKDYERRSRSLNSGNSAPAFSLVDEDGRRFTKEDLKGKVALIDFWFTGCKGCVQMSSALRKVERAFAGKPGVDFISISVDEDKSVWKRSIKQQKYTTGDGVNLYAGERKIKEDLIKDYSLYSFPALYLLDPYGNIVQNPLPDPRSDEGEQLCRLINRQIARMNDGPYVFHKSDSILSYSIEPDGIKIKRFKGERQEMLLQVQTDQMDQFFTFHLKPALDPEPSVFEDPERLYILSDIEGNFEAFRKLLQSANIIDEHFNWTFGNGHLVLVGDFFDRGMQVTECLWLIYSMEEQAKKEGGYVHFILGNHEIMNIQGNLKYCQQKYKDNMQRMQIARNKLWGEDSELGRWLRTKNIIEKIGNILFVHGGIARAVNELPADISEMNDMARLNYGNIKGFTDIGSATLFGSKTSPFWFRDYYRTDDSSKIASKQLINKTLRKFDVAQIITGHTIVADTINVHFDGKLINTDTEHADGKSEALLIDNGMYFRIDAAGRKRRLFRQSDFLTISSVY